MKNKLQKWYNSFSGRIILIVTLGFLSIAAAITFVLLFMSQRIFIHTYTNSLEKIMDQMENDFSGLHNSLSDTIHAIDSSWAFRLYLTQQNGLDNLALFQTIYQMEEDLNQSLPSSLESPNILVLGVNGAHYLSRTETISSTHAQILQSQAARAAYAHPNQLNYTFASGAFTATTKHQNVLIVSKALSYQNTSDIYGIVFITLTQKDLRNFYNYFVTDNTQVFLVDHSGTVVCASDPSQIGKPADFSAPSMTILHRELAYQGTTLYGVVDDQLALTQLYNLPVLVCVCIAISSILLFAVVCCTKRVVKPLSRMADKMSQVSDITLAEYVPVEGTTEMKDLAGAYNRMLQKLKEYIQQLVDTQQKQRKAEIRALQMQINPHYIYNTLTSIKMLVYQNAQQQAAQTIDAFISLLRNTITNTDEFITVQKELDNLNNYVTIIHTRYGQFVQAEYYVSQNCYNCLIPKMMIQPFIENAFFHAFPSGQTGTIQVLVSQKAQNLIIRIVDDGVGMPEQKADEIVRQDMKKEYFSGIGIHNVNERLQLLFGKEYGVRIISKPQEGTTIILTVPVKY